jgi:hypothetical protein
MTTGNMRSIRQKMLFDHPLMVDFIKQEVARENYEKALKLLEYLAGFIYKFPYMKDFHDADLEAIVQDLSYRICGRPLAGLSTTKRVVLVDSFGWDARGFTQQYLRALKDLGYEVLLIKTSSLNAEMSQNIKLEIANGPGLSMLEIEDTQTYAEKIREIRDAIIAFGPEQIVLHLSPWDVTAIAAMHQFPHIKKIMIDITDHSFWLGTKIVDKLVVFRVWGQYLGKKRGIPSSFLRT